MTKNRKKLNQPKGNLYIVFVTYFQFSTILFSLLSYRPIAAEYAERNIPVVEKIEAPGGKIKLTNLNPWTNRWFILELVGKKLSFHLENTYDQNKLSLAVTGIAIRPPQAKEPFLCELWGQEEMLFFSAKLKKFTNPYFPLCHGLLYVRLKRNSDTQFTTTEKVTSFLRKHTSWGESLISSIKPHIVRFSAEADGNGMIAHHKEHSDADDHHFPTAAKMKSTAEKIPISLNNSLGIRIKNSDDHIRYGKWHQTKLYDNVYISLFKPGLINSEIADSFKERTKKITQEERDKLIYLIAYDLDHYAINYAIGTEHPNINMKTLVNDTNQSAVNIVAIGKIPPYRKMDAVGVFIGGFKSRHGYFKRGPHSGKTYGYIEGGVEINPMSEGLATLLVSKSGEVDIIKWPLTSWQRAGLRKSLVAARQNGVPLIHDYKPGRYVGHWGNGNWSGSSSGNLKTLRSAVCISQRGESKRFLIFSGFTYATPSTIAKALMAYNCKVAMHLDMNAYMYIHNALFKKTPKGLTVEYLHKDMEYPKGIKKHRFILDNNNRDFFYVYRRNSGSETNKISANSRTHIID